MPENALTTFETRADEFRAERHKRGLESRN
jgi:hypothetical protein